MMKKRDMYKILIALSASALLAGCGSGDERGDTLVGEACTETLECVPSSICFNAYCIGEGKLRVTLSFFADTDLDLHLLTPNGIEISFGNDTDDGGILDVDQCTSPCGEGMHIENIVFDTAAPHGTYEVWAENYDGRAAASFGVEFIGTGIVAEAEGNVGAVEGAESEHLFFEF